MEVIGKVVGPYQHAFIAGRQISDALWLPMSVLTHAINPILPLLPINSTSKKPMIMCIGTFSWLFSREWAFVGSEGGGCIFVSLHTTVHFPILDNGEATGFSPSTRGIWQGDPLSPLLFILAIETLSRLIIKANEVRFLEGLHIKGSSSKDLSISHLLFVDYTLTFCKPQESHLGYLRCILVPLKWRSGLKINLPKSTIIPISEVPEPNNLAYFFGCGVDYLPLSYLGPTLGAPHKCTAVWELVVERFWKKLVGENLNFCLKEGD